MRGIVSDTLSRTPSLIARVAVLVLFMLAAGPAWADDEYQSAGGLAVYFGVVPASVVRGHPPGHTEGTMHGGAEKGSHQKHLVVAVFDAATGARIENAQVVASIEGLGHVGRQRVELEPMAIAGTITYGGFVNFPGTISTAFRSTSPFRADPDRSPWSSRSNTPDKAIIKVKADRARSKLPLRG